MSFDPLFLLLIHRLAIEIRRFDVSAVVFKLTSDKENRKPVVSEAQAENCQLFFGFYLKTISPSDIVKA